MSGGARLLLFAPPAPAPAALAQPQLRDLILQYFAAAQSRPWLSVWPVLAVRLGAPLAAASWTVGRAAARLFAER